MLENKKKFSIIIITFNRPVETLDCIKSIVNNASHKHIGEVIVINNNSKSCYKKFEQALDDFPVKVNYHLLNENLGVAGGRNYGIEVSKYENLFFIDDDAEIDSDVLEKANFFYESNPEISILAVKSVNYFTKKINFSEFPCHDKNRVSLPSFTTTHFIGVGHFIKKYVFRECGLYPKDYMYGMEEYDLSYRCVAKDLKIAYSQDLVVLHKKSEHGRFPSREVSEKLSINKITVAYKYMPFVLFLSHIIAWSFRYAYVQKLRGVDKYLISLYKRLVQTDRNVNLKLKITNLIEIKKSGNSIFY
jgi:GT2 family glycosyltransferase